jgi:glutamate/tyrosine decarboxylase-like PLP-dependent enzyme
MTDLAGTEGPLDLSWEWSVDEIKRFGYQVVDLISGYLTELPERPVWQPYPAELAQSLLLEAAPQTGEEADALLAEFATRIAPYPFGNGHPRYFAWVNSPPATMGIFAEALAAAMNPSCAGGNHAAVYLERQVIRWFKQIFGFPEPAMGLLVSGGSMATLTALAVARQSHAGAGIDLRAAGLQHGGPRLLIYRSDQAHSCVQKSVELLGIGSDNLRTIPVDQDYRLDVAQLEAAILSDMAAGHRPLAVVASAGTTNTGAIDPLREIAEVCRRHDLWLHVDGAYGALALLSPRYRAELAPLALADSLAFDPHKWMSVPYEAGLVLVRDADALRATFSLIPEYLRIDAESEGGVHGPTWFSEYGFLQTRGFLALKVWMALKHSGLDGYTRAVEHDLALAEHLATRVEASPLLELAAPPSLSIVCFRYVPAALAGDDERLNRLNQRLLDRVQQSGEAFLSSTTLTGRLVLRACIVNYRSTRADIDRMVDAVLGAGESLTGPE